ncbi:ABC transporter substrate-binding protein [Homoserinibacter gongjuensis]|uniref:Sugar ABC transporter substrate-binding protein n=1 Tax=Homoserinibacter gongjuensis TaxID=1162968 RepID=A0ABQ6JVG8_9MICO|nr:extracellular solute-binding protein [Homoserinibacter gongjuensis]GMA92306.1 sugar ABC transporter substrate-binding protein [Homoserinibacter gongjuensis]
MRNVAHVRPLLASATALVVVAGLAACAPGSDDPNAVTIRVAMGSSGDAVDNNFEVLKEQYEDRYPGRTVEIVIQEDDVYQTTGLATLLSSREAPDAYFEWSGARMAGHVADGDGADISEALAGPLFEGRFDEGAFNNMDVDGSGIYMVPWTGDVTNVVWYDVDVFDELGIDVPETWDDYLAANKKMLSAGYVPLVEGNKDQWPVGSIASHIVSRMIGEDAYAAVINGETPMNSPEMVGAFEKIAELAPYVNPSINALADDEAMTQFFLQRAATHQIGSWLMADAVENADGLNFSYFNLPAFEDGKGAQDSVLGVSTGFMVNAKSDHIDETLEFLALVASSEGTKMWAESGLVPLANDPFEGVDADERTVALAELLTNAGELVVPADNYADLEIAELFYGAAASVIGGTASPQEALDTAQARIDAR